MLEHEGNSVNGHANEAGARHIDEGTVHAWLDGQLSADEAARVERHVAACGACSALVAEARGHVAAATRILNSLEWSADAGGPASAPVVAPVAAAHRGCDRGDGHGYRGVPARVA